MSIKLARIRASLIRVVAEPDPLVWNARMNSAARQGDQRRHGTALLDRGPVVAEVGIGMILCPPVECPGESRCLSASLREVLVEHEDEDQIMLCGVVGDVLGNDSPPFSSRGRRDGRVVGGLQADLADMGGVMTVFLAQ